MSQYSDFVSDFSDRVTEGLERVQEFQLEQIRMWQESFGQLAAMAPKMPVNENIPSFDTVVKANFSFAERLLENQRKFAMGVSEALKTKAEPTDD